MVDAWVQATATLALVSSVAAVVCKRRLRVQIAAAFERAAARARDGPLTRSLRGTLSAYVYSQPANRNVMLGSSTIAAASTDIGDLEFVNLGVPSLATTHMLAAVDLLQKTQLETAIVYIGVNDLHRALTPSDTASNIDRILRALPAKLIVYIPIIASDYQRLLGTARVAHVKKINDLVGHLVADLPHVRQLPFVAEDADFGADRLHLNKDGHRRLNAKLAATLSHVHGTSRMQVRLGD